MTPGESALLPLFAPAAATAATAETAAIVSEPGSPDPEGSPDLEPTYRLHVTIPKRTLERLDHARDLLAHQVPDRDTAKILDRALQLLVEHLERRKFAALKRG